MATKKAAPKKAAPKRAAPKKVEKPQVEDPFGYGPVRSQEAIDAENAPSTER